jgi:hypothetical protein
MDSRSIYVLVGMLVAVMALADGAYTWVDEDGVVHFSDVPVEGAEVINLSEYSRTTGASLTRARPENRNTSGDSATPTSAFRYESISIDVPGAEETLWNIEATLNVTVRMSPPLQSGHQIRAYFDGESRMVGSTSFTIDEVYRGVHNLQVEVVDSTGKLMIRSVTNRFYVQQNTVGR